MALPHSCAGICVAALYLLTQIPGAHAQDPLDGLTDAEKAAIFEAVDSDAEESAEAPAATGVMGIIEGMNPEISLILDFAFAWFSDPEPLQAGAHDPKANGFNLQQLELHLGASVDPYFRMDANIVFSQFGVEVEEAYATTLGLPGGLQVRAGQFLTKMGRANPTHPHSWAFVDQRLINATYLGPEGSRGLGLEVSWLTPLPWFVEVSASAHQADGACCARSFWGGNAPPVDGPEDLLYTVNLKQFFELSDDWSLSWGLSTQLGPNPNGPNARTELYATDLTLRWRAPRADRMSLTLEFEAMVRARQIPSASLTDGGGVVSLEWAIDPIWSIAGRFEWLSGVAPSLTDPLDPDAIGSRHRSALQVTARPSHFSRIRLQGSVDRPTWREDPIFGVVLAMEWLIGAHGAHAW